MKPFKIPSFTFSYHIDRPERQLIHNNITTLSTPSFSFYLMVAISTIIAAYGLLANSTAVIIGAMLVAPLMGPIFGIALALSNGNNHLLRNALRSEIFGIILAITIATIIGLLPFRPNFTPEMIARTQPNIYDILIALASGLAGAYSIINTKVSSTLTGVAISVALVPPLATVGLCISVQNYEWALGAFLLFIVNLLAIEFAAATVFTLSGLAKLDDENNLMPFLQKFGVSLVALLVMAFFMTQTLINIASDRTLNNQLHQILSEEIKATAGARLSEVRYEEKNGITHVMATALTPQQIEAYRVAAMEEILRQKINPNLRLVVRSLISRDYDRNGQVFISEEKRIQQSLEKEETIQLGTISKTLNQEILSIPGSRIVDIQNALESDGSKKIVAIMHTPTPITPNQVAKMEKSLKDALQQPLHLYIRSILTKEATANRYIYDDSPLLKTSTTSEFEFYNQLNNIVTNQLAEQEPDSKILEMHYKETTDSLVVILQILSPRALHPNDIRILESALQEKLNRKIQLIVRSTVGADLSSQYYLKDYDEILTNTLKGQ